MGLRPDIDLAIDELDLTAVPASRRHQVAATFERELTRLLTAGGLPGRDGGVEPPGEGREVRLHVRLDANPVVVGQALAIAVYEALR